MTMTNERTASAPASIGNVGPGFDILGLAVQGPEDRVTARLANHAEVRIVAIDSPHPGADELPTDVERNTAGIAAVHTRRVAGREDIGIDLEIHKGIQLESGLGSSAASAAAASFAVNQLLGCPLRTADLIGPCLEAEAAVSGRHADNVAPALLGGLVLVRSWGERPRAQRLPVPAGLLTVVVSPRARLSTKLAREAVPETIPLEARTRNAVNIATFISACYSNDIGLLTECIEDRVVTDARLPLIPGGARAIQAARDAGALASTISGAGPSLFAFCHSTPVAESIAQSMTAAFGEEGIEARAVISPADCAGARLVRNAPAEGSP